MVNRVERRPLGNTGIDVSVLGLGTVKLGRTAGLKYPDAFELPSDDAVRSLLDAAADLGVNLIDTAPAYQLAESRLGELLPGPRDRWVLCTKAGESFDGERSTYDFSPEAIIASVERSLVRLRTDRLDVVLLHSDGSSEASFGSRGSYDALAELKARGVVRAIGASTKTAEGAREAIARTDVVMLTFNAGYHDDEPAIAAAQEAGAGVLIKKALASGHLDQAGGVEGALRLVLGTAGVTSAVVGTISPEHLRANAEAAVRACASAE